MHIDASGVLVVKVRAKRDAPPVLLRLRGIMANPACGQQAILQSALCKAGSQTVAGEIRLVRCLRRQAARIVRTGGIAGNVALGRRGIGQVSVIVLSIFCLFLS
jgi:hypothetical protein